MIPSAHIGRSYHGLSRPWKRKPCFKCGCNFKVETKRFYAKLLFKKHRIDKKINSMGLSNIPIVGPTLEMVARTSALQTMYLMESRKRSRQKAPIMEPMPGEYSVPINFTGGGDDERN